MGCAQAAGLAIYSHNPLSRTRDGSFPIGAQQPMENDVEGGAELSIRQAAVLSLALFSVGSVLLVGLFFYPGV